MNELCSMNLFISKNEYHIAVIDDEDYYLTKMKSLLNSFFPCAEIDLYHSIDEMLEHDGNFILAVVDVKLDQKSGIEQSALITDRVSYIVYYSILAEEIRKAFRYNTIGYLLKTDTEEYIFQQFKRYNAEYFSVGLFVRTEVGFTRIHIKDIIKIISENRKIFLYTVSGDDRIRLFEQSLNELEKSSNGNLVYIHKSVLVNIMHITFIDLKSGRIVLSDGSDEYIAKRQRKNVYTAFLEKRVK